MPSNCEAETKVPTVLWAQNKNNVYLTIEAGDVEKPDFEVTDNKITFSGYSESAKTNYAFSIDLFGEVNSADTTYVGGKSSRNWFLTLKKKESGPFWNRLCKQPAKMHWIHVDWSRWKDDGDMSDDDRDLGDFNYEPSSDAFGEEDSDDDEMPDVDENEDNKMDDDDNALISEENATANEKPSDVDVKTA